MRPLQTEYAPAFQRYIDCTTERSITDLINAHEEAIQLFYNNLPEAKADFAYAENKWTIKEVLQHLIDAERVFIYRAMTFARKDKTALPGFEENDWAANCNASSRTLNELKKEFTALHHSTVLFLQSLNDDQLSQTGLSNNNPLSVNALAFVSFGHLLHHKKILEERYFIPSSIL